MKTKHKVMCQECEKETRSIFPHLGKWVCWGCSLKYKKIIGAPRTIPKNIFQSGWWKRQKRLASEFRLSAEDLHNLMDLFYMVDNPPELKIDLWSTLKLNKMDKWFSTLWKRVEDVCLEE